MALRLYFVTLLGTGTSADAFRPALLQGRQVDACDGRPNLALIGGEFAMVLDTDQTEHTAMLATVGVTYAPFENALGVPRLPSDPLSSVSAANRATLTTLFEARHIPIDDLVGTDPCRLPVRRAVVRMLIRQILGADDLTEGLDTLVSTIALARRQRIANLLQAAGYDTTGMNAMTVRQALAFLASQMVRMSRTGEDS